MRTAEEHVKIMEEALETIRFNAMDHPLFNHDLFKKRDHAGLCRLGGDEAFVTDIAILADQALRGENPNE